MSITNHLDILRERLLRQIAKNRSKKPVRLENNEISNILGDDFLLKDVGQTNPYESGNLVSIG